MSSPSAHEVLAKFEFYFLALTFTFLGLSLHTSDLIGAPLASKVLEVTAWSLLGLSGFIGLSKVNWISSIILLRERRDSFEKMMEELRKSKAMGQPRAIDTSSGKMVAVDELLENAGKAQSNVSDTLKKLGTKHEIKHMVQWWSFYIAILSFIVGRAIQVLR